MRTRAGFKLFLLSYCLRDLYANIVAYDIQSVMNFFSVLEKIKPHLITKR